MSLRKKIIAMCVGNVLLVTLTIGAIMTVQMNRLTDHAVQANDEFTDIAGEMSASSMTAQIRQRMSDMTRSNARLADARFEELENQVGLLADLTEQIFSNPDPYAAREIPLPDAANDGQLSVQFLHSASVTDLQSPAVAKKVGLLGNLQDTLYEVNSRFENMASDYVAIEPGVLIQADYISAAKFDKDGEILPYEADTRPWYRGAKQTGTTYFTPVSRDAHTEGTGIMCGVPIYVDDKFI